MRKVPENKGGQVMTCRFCGHQGPWVVLCNREADIMTRAIGGNERCYETIKKMGGGQSGMRYIDTYRKITKRA